MDSFICALKILLQYFKPKSVSERPTLKVIGIYGVRQVIPNALLIFFAFHELAAAVIFAFIVLRWRPFIDVG